MKIPNIYVIPDNIMEWVGSRDGVAIDFSINPAFGDFGYAHVVWKTLQVLMLTRTCGHCGYNQVWKRNPKKQCNRHSYGSWRYDVVFQYGYTEDEEPTEKIAEAFKIWQDSQPSEYEWDKPYKFMSFGENGWR